MSAAWNERPKARVSWTVILWGLAFALVGGGLAITGVAAPLGDPPWRGPLVSAAVGVAVVGAFFLALGVFVIRRGPRQRDFTPTEKLVLRAAAAMIKVDGDAVHVEVEALRAWARRVYGLEIERDEIRRLAESNREQKDREWIEGAIKDRHVKQEGWGAEQDTQVIQACTAVLVADLRNRDEEKAFLRRLAEAVGRDAPSRDALIGKLDALERALEDLVVQKVMTDTAVQSAA